MKLTKHLHAAITLGRARVSMLGADGEAWDHLVYAGRAMERDRWMLRAWQLHVLWLNISIWKHNCTPLMHDMHLSGEDVIDEMERAFKSAGSIYGDAPESLRNGLAAVVRAARSGKITGMQMPIVSESVAATCSVAV